LSRVKTSDIPAGKHVTLGFDIQKLLESGRRRRRRSSANSRDRCPKAELLCKTKCLNMPSRTFACSYSSGIGTKYSCSCSSSESNKSVKRIETQIASSSELLKLLESIDTSWHVTRTVTIGKKTFHKGDLLLKEGSLRGATGLDALRKVTIGESSSITVLSRTSSSSSSSSDKTVKKESSSSEEKKSSSSSEKVVASESIQVRVEALEKKVASLKGCCSKVGGLSTFRRRRRSLVLSLRRRRRSLLPKNK